ncbi:MAG: T9SS type A sorting domain-containing protein [Flavobacteriales bacterium]
MKANSLCILCAVVNLGLVQIAQAQGFNRHYDAQGGGFDQTAFGIEKGGLGHMVFSGSFEPDTLGPDSIVGVYVYILDQLDQDGNVTTTKRLQLPGHSIFLGWADCCDNTTDDGFVIGGGSTEYYTDRIEARLMRFTENSDTLWTRSYGSAGHFWISFQVKQTPDGGFLICGYTDATGYYYDGFALKTDSMGNEQWRQTYGLSNIDDNFSSISLVPDGYVLSGTSIVSPNNYDLFASKIDTSGNAIWSIRLGSPYNEASSNILYLQDGRLVLAGSWGSALNGFGTLFVSYLDLETGDTLYTRKYGSAHYTTAIFASKQFPDSDIIHAGVSYSEGPQQGVLIRTNSDGDSLWMRNYYYYDEDVEEGEGRFFDVLPTPDNGCIAAGVALNPVNAPYPPGHSQDTWVVKVDSMGCVVPGCDGVIGITELVTNLTDALHLYPNPVQDQLHVGIDLPPKLATTGPLTLTVTSLAGQVVLKQAVPTSAPDAVVLDVSQLASGMYSLHLSDAHTWLAGSKFVVE